MFYQRQRSDYNIINLDRDRWEQLSSVLEAVLWLVISQGAECSGVACKKTQLTKIKSLRWLQREARREELWVKRSHVLLQTVWLGPENSCCSNWFKRTLFWRREVGELRAAGILVHTHSDWREPLLSLKYECHKRYLVALSCINTFFIKRVMNSHWEASVFLAWEHRNSYEEIRFLSIDAYQQCMTHRNADCPASNFWHWSEIQQSLSKSHGKLERAGIVQIHLEVLQ